MQNITLRDLRRLVGLTIDELSRRSRIERSRISRAERGYTLLRPDELQRIAPHVGVNASDLCVSSNAA